MKIYRNPQTVHAPLASYSHQIELDPSERLLFLSGQIGMRQDGSMPDDALEQIKVVLANIRLNLEAAGMTASDLVKLTMYLVDHVDTEERRRILAEFSEGTAPCMTLIYVAALATPDIRVEIDAVASRAE